MSRSSKLVDVVASPGTPGGLTSKSPLAVPIAASAAHRRIAVMAGSTRNPISRANRRFLVMYQLSSMYMCVHRFDAQGRLGGAKQPSQATNQPTKALLLRPQV